MFEADPSGVLRKFRGFVDIDMLQRLVTLPEFNGPVNQSRWAGFFEGAHGSLTRKDGSCGRGCSLLLYLYLFYSWRDRSFQNLLCSRPVSTPIEIITWWNCQINWLLITTMEQSADKRIHLAAYSESLISCCHIREKYLILAEDPISAEPCPS